MCARGHAAVGKLEKLTVFGDDYDTHDGTGVRDYIHIVDLAKGHVAAVDKIQEIEGEEVYNLGTGRERRMRLAGVVHVAGVAVAHAHCRGR